MSAPLYNVVTGGAVALVAATAKTVLAVIAHANSGLGLRKVRVGFDGVTAAAVPVLVELCYSTFATAGTNTAVTPLQVSGRVLTVGFTAAKNYTAEPTVLTVLDELLIHAQAGMVWHDIPLGDEYDSAVSQGFAIRITSPATLNTRATMAVFRI